MEGFCHMTLKKRLKGLSKNKKYYCRESKLFKTIDLRTERPYVVARKKAMYYQRQPSFKVGVFDKTRFVKSGQLVDCFLCAKCLKNLTSVELSQRGFSHDYV